MRKADCHEPAICAIYPLDLKAKEIIYGLGFRPGVREYSFDIDSFVMPREGEVSFARWRHPKEPRKEITQEAVDALRAFVKPGDTAIDVGAHSGDTTLPLALAAGKSGAVFALEPNPYVFKVLLANAGLNRRKANIYAFNFAATPEDGEFEFKYSDAGFCNGGWHEGVARWRHANFFKLRVQGRNLAGFLEKEFPEEAGRVRFIKIDTEGADHQVVMSLRPLLARIHPYIRSEVYEHLASEARFAYYDELRTLGYRVHKFVSLVDYAGPELCREDLTKWRHFDIFAVPEG